MIAPLALFLIVIGYVLLLFALAYYAEIRETAGRSLINNPYIYSLSLAVYCTSWTFYGSVGLAATSGLAFLPIYLGPTLMVALWPILLKKVVRIVKANRITTIADFIGYRYGKSLALSVLATLVAVLGIIPYLGLQIKSIISTFVIITGKVEWAANAGLIITVLLGLFIIIFGVRRLDLSERHGGLVFAIACESIVKLTAFVLVGAFVTWGLFEGVTDISERIQSSGYTAKLMFGAEGGTNYTEWLAVSVLGMLGILFLPRQFHMAVIENNHEDHIDKAVWLFPLYLLLVTLFVLPIAFGGLLLQGSHYNPDYFVLTLPLAHGSSTLTVLAFIGGFSAATGMLIVEVLALSTMVMNSVIIPGSYKFHGLPGFSAIVLTTKRLVVLAIVFLGYLFTITIGGQESLVTLGLKSFEAVALFAPAFLFGLYWKGGNKYGAMAGLSGGFVVWLYTAIIPPLLQAGLLDQGGPIGTMTACPFLNPAVLFGIKGLGTSAHTLFWSMLVNVLLYCGVSLFTRQSKEEELQAVLFTESYAMATGLGHRVSYALPDIEHILARFMGAAEVARIVEGFLVRRKKNRNELRSQDLFELRVEAEKALAGSIGPSLASAVFENRFVLTEPEKKEIAESMERVTESLRLSRQELAEANKELQKRLEMEMLLATISTRFINLTPGQLQGGIDEALAEVGRFSGFDRAYVAVLSSGAMKIERIYEWCADGVAARSDVLCTLPLSSCPWLMGQLAGFEHVLVTRVTALPPAAGPEKAFLEGQGIRGCLLIPMVYGDSLFGVLGFDSISRDVEWKKEEIALLMLLGMTFVHAIVRTRVMEELERSNRELQQFAYVASHDLQEPLRKVITFGDRLKAHCAAALDERGQDYLHRMQNASLRMRQLIEDLLAYSRVTTKGNPMETVNLGEVVRHVLSDLDQAIVEAGARVEVGDLPEVEADKAQMGQLFQNLIANAIKYHQAGVAPQAVVSGRVAPDGTVAEILVRDNGIGFDEKYLDRIFLPFQRLHTREEYKGTGIGLAICKKIVERHGGAISAKTSPGRGATFVVTLPVTR